MGDKNKAEDSNVDDNDNKLFLRYLCCDGFPEEDVSCQEAFPRDEKKPVACDREEKVSWDLFLNTKAEFDSSSATADKKEVEREEEEKLKQHKAQRAKIQNVFKQERSLIKPRKEEGKELVINIKKRKSRKYKAVRSFTNVSTAASRSV